MKPTRPSEATLMRPRVLEGRFLRVAGLAGIPSSSGAGIYPAPKVMGMRGGWGITLLGEAVASDQVYWRVRTP